MKKGEVSQVANLTREGQLEFLLDLYERGIDISEEDRRLLLTHKMIKPAMAEKPKKDRKSKEAAAIDKKSFTQNKADEYVDIIEDGDVPFAEEGKRHVIMDDETYDKIVESPMFTYQGGREITSADWMPKDKIYHEPEFINWINSINSGFQSMTRYKKFAMYCQQAKDWMDDPVSLSSFDTLEEKKEYTLSEIERCKQNTLYFMDKYLYYKEPSAVNSGGMRSYSGKPVHKVICYMVDCGYSMEIGKPRQIAATTTLGGIALAKLILNRNFFIKMIAQDKEKVQEIYDDKIMFPFGELPSWLRPAVSNFRENFLRLSKKGGEKGTRGGVNSKLQVVAPSTSAINGGAPPLVLIDEAGYIGILGKMIKEARPTMFMMDEETGKLEMVRQIVIWGTGGEMDKGGKAYENEFYDSLSHWEKGNFEHGIIPLFFDWTTRPGITKQFYLNEKKIYTVEGPEKEAKMVQFRQTYPSIVEDMFLTSQKLLVGIDWINQNKERIKNQEHVSRPVKGYFEPIYDQTVAADENSDTPYKIIGATFVPLDDLKDDMGRATVEILFPPKQGWKNRYYQGTDPIMTDTGYSNMSSVIYDARFNCPVAIFDYRENNHKAVFLQCMLLGIYYDTEGKGCVPELVESNIGSAYIDYKESKGFGRDLVQRLELPDHLQGGGQLYGIDNRGQRNKFIINKMYEVLSLFGERVWFNKVFNQLRTFNCTVSESGNEKWGTSDPRNFHDDVLFGLVFSYICAQSYTHREPFDGSSEGKRFKVVHKITRDANGNLTRVPTRVRT